MLRQVGKRLIIGCKDPGGLVEKKPWLKRIEERKEEENLQMEYRKILSRFSR